MTDAAEKLDIDWSSYWQRRCLKAEARADRYEMTARAVWEDRARLQWVEKQLLNEQWKSEFRKAALVNIASGDGTQTEARFVLAMTEDVDT